MTILVLLSLLFGSDSFSPENVLQGIRHEQSAATLEMGAKRFYLIGKGSQFFAFESEDHSMVLKLFKARHYLPQFSKRLQLFLSSALREKSEERWKKKFLETCTCYELAYEDLQSETGLIALHFNKTERSDLLVTLVDGKKEFVLDLNKFPFILQKKATLLPDYLSKLPCKEEQKKAITAVKRLFEERTKKLITDQRQSLRINYGFVEGKAIQIDPGKIYKDPELDQSEEIKRLNARVNRWVLKHFPE